MPVHPKLLISLPKRVAPARHLCRPGLLKVLQAAGPLLAAHPGHAELARQRRARARVRLRCVGQVAPAARSQVGQFDAWMAGWWYQS